MKLGPSDRSEATQAKYQHDVDNNLLVGLENEPPVVEHKHWKLIVNAYGATARWKESMLLVSKRVVPWGELTDEEILEHDKLQTMYLEEYDEAKRNGRTQSSIPKHAHSHLYRGRRRKLI